MAAKTPSRIRLLILALAAGGLAGAVVAQPTPTPLPPEEVAAPGAPAAEEAPPAEVAAPAPIAAPPVKDEEVAPAAAPKAQVAEKPVEAPIRRPRYDIAVLQALDKVTAETLRFEAPVGRPVRWKGLVFTVGACERSAPDEPVEDSIAYLTIDSQPRAQPGRPTPPSREAFKGWMYASSPSLHPLEHATYDTWVISCSASRPLSPAAEPAVRPVAAAPPPVKAPEPKASPPKTAATPPAKAPPSASPAPASPTTPPVAAPEPTP